MSANLSGAHNVSSASAANLIFLSALVLVVRELLCAVIQYACVVCASMFSRSYKGSLTGCDDQAGRYSEAVLFEAVITMPIQQQIEMTLPTLSSRVFFTSNVLHLKYVQLLMYLFGFFQVAVGLFFSLVYTSLYKTQFIY